MKLGKLEKEILRACIRVVEKEKIFADHLGKCIKKCEESPFEAKAQAVNINVNQGIFNLHSCAELVGKWVLEDLEQEFNVRYIIAAIAFSRGIEPRHKPWAKREKPLKFWDLVIGADRKKAKALERSVQRALKSLQEKGMIKATEFISAGGKRPVTGQGVTVWVDINRWIEYFQITDEGRKMILIVEKSAVTKSQKGGK